MEASKKPWQSKTIVLNALFGLFALVALFAPLGAQHLHDVLANNGAIVAAVWSGLNILLRFVSKDKIQLGE